MPEPADHLAARMDKLEEGATFADRRSEQLSDEIIELNKRLHEASSRIDRLERLIDTVTRDVAELGDPGTQAPPHAAGPDVTRDPI